MILVTGGAGFIGHHLCKRLARDGYDVVSLDDYSTGSEDNHVPGVTYRRGHTTGVAIAIPERPDVIFHLGEYSRVESSFADVETVKHSNIYGTEAVLRYWDNRGSKLVYAGSSAMFATDGAGSPYTTAKSSNVNAINTRVSMAGSSASITYFYNVYGPRERPADQAGTVIETFRRQYLAGEPLTVVAPGTQRRNFTHVDDIVEGLMLAMIYDGEFPIGAEESYSILEVAQMFGAPIEMLPERRGNRLDSTIDTSAIKAWGWKQKHRLVDYIGAVTKEVAA